MEESCRDLSLQAKYYRLSSSRGRRGSALRNASSNNIVQLVLIATIYIINTVRIAINTAHKIG